MSDGKLVALSLAVVVVAIVIFFVTRKHHGPKVPPSGPTGEHDERRNNGKVP